MSGYKREVTATIFRVEKKKDFTVMSNHHLRSDMSLKAKGLLSLILSLPDNWDYSIDGLVAMCKEGKNAVMTALKELKTHGYLVIERIYPDMSESGRIEYIYHVYEEPKAPKKDP